MKVVSVPSVTVMFGSGPCVISTNLSIPPFGFVLTPSDVRFGISTLILKLRLPAGVLTCPPLFERHSTASTPFLFASTC